MFPGPREKKDAIHSLGCKQQLREASSITEMSAVGCCFVERAQASLNFPNSIHPTIPSVKVNTKNRILILILRTQK